MGSSSWALLGTASVRVSNLGATTIPRRTTTGGLMVPEISRDELKMKIDRGEQFLLVETLPAATYHHAHLPGAINLPPDQVTQLAPTLLPDKGADIVVYCASPT